MMVKGISDFKMLFFPYKRFKNKRKAHLRLGRWGEKQSCQLLQRKGFTILLRNYRSHVGELDIVALDGKTLVFVEVKTLAKATVFRPIHNYSYRQNKRNILAAKSYIRQLYIPVEDVRFDFIEVVGTPFKLQSIQHYQNFAVIPKYQN